MNSETTIEERKAHILMELRGLKLLEREEQKEIISFLSEMPKDGKKLLLWCILTHGAVGVRYLDQLKKAMEKSGAEGGIIVTSGKYTPATKVRAEKKNIELIPEGFPAFNIFEHTLVPKHEVLTLEEKEEVLAKYRVKPYQLPWIKASDPAAIAVGAKPGDVLRIIRESPTAGKYFSYRYVVES